jgi:hypothetical protein
MSLTVRPIPMAYVVAASKALDAVMVLEKLKTGTIPHPIWMRVMEAEIDLRAYLTSVMAEVDIAVIPPPAQEAQS